MNDDVFVWEGRFQPIHKGHVAYVGELLKLCDRLVIVVVANEVSAGRATPVPSFSSIVDEHHRGEKNPWPHWFRQQLVAQTLKTVFPEGDITVLAGHRLDLDWQLYDDLLPPGRTFAVPTRDAFEEDKARAWLALGQEVRRVEVGHLPEVSGTLVRQRMAAGGPLDALLEPITCRLLNEYQLR